MLSTSDVDDKNKTGHGDPGCDIMTRTPRLSPDTTARRTRGRAKKDVQAKLIHPRINLSRNTSDIPEKLTKAIDVDGGCHNMVALSIFTPELTAKQKRGRLGKDIKDTMIIVRTDEECGAIAEVSDQPCKTMQNDSRNATYNLNKAVGVKSSFKCPKCMKRFLREASLSRHIASTHDQVCDVCAKVFTHRSTLNRHRRLHTERPFKCSVCEKAFSFSYYLQQHEARHQITKKTPSSLAKQLHCLVCNSVHPSRVDLWHHQRSCHGKDSVTAALCLKCDICSKELTSSRGFRVHQLIHEGVRAHVCKTCGAAFYDKCHLQRHSRRNSGCGVKCDMCGERFASRWHVQQHKLQKHPRTSTVPPTPSPFPTPSNLPQGSLIRHHSPCPSADKSLLTG